MKWVSIARKLLASLAALAAVLVLFRAAPFLGSESEPQKRDVSTYLTPVEPGAPVETVLAGLPLESSSQPVADCIAEAKKIARQAACEGCVDMGSGAAAEGSFMWLEPRPSFELEPWRLRAELLHCEGTGGTRFSYASAPGRDRSDLARPLPLGAGATEILRVGHPGWSFTIDQVPGPQALKTAEVELRLQNWRPLEAAGTSELPESSFAMVRENEICIVARERLNGEDYLMTLVQRQT